MSDHGHRDAAAADRAAELGPEGLLTGDVGAPTAGGAPRFRLRGALELFFAADGDAYLLRGGGGAEHVIRQPTDNDRRLLRALAGDGVATTSDPNTQERLAPLIAAGAVVEASPPEALTAAAERFTRQLAYLEDFGDPIEAQRRLRAGRVGILGCGGLGTWTLAALASCGVGRFVLVDDDTVDVSNLNRQILYGAAQVGASKVALAGAWLRAFDPDVEAMIIDGRVTGPADLGWVAGCDVVVVVADHPPYVLNRWVNEVCVEHGVPFIVAGQQPPLVKIGPLFMPGEGACFACLERRLRREFVLYDELVEHRRITGSTATTLGPSSGLIGTLLALEVMHLLVGHRPLATHDQVLLVDMRTLTTRWEAVAVDPECATCGPR